MKDIFKAFYNVNKDDLKESWKSDSTIFVFDTNVFLNLYGYAKQTRDDFFNIIEKLRNNIWIPHQVGLEYQRRRLEVIKNEKIVFNEIENNLTKIQNVFKGDFEKLSLKRRFPKLSENTDKLEKEINKLISNYKKSVSHWDDEQPCVRSHDEIRELLNNYFENSVGEKPSDQTWLDDLYAEGKERYKNRIPPGFKDADKAKGGEEKYFIFDGLNYEREFGDLILWKQLLKKASEDNINTVIFVTDDAKEDWWYKINSNGKKVVGPLAELQAEIYRETDIKQFHMYSTSAFMGDGKINLSVDVNESSIEDAGTLHQEVERTVQKRKYSLTNSENMKRLMQSYENPLKEHEEIQKLMQSYENPLKEYEKAQKLMLLYENPLKEYEKAQKLMLSYETPLKEYEKAQKLMQPYENPLKDYEEVQKHLSAYENPLKEHEKIQKLIQSLHIHRRSNNSDE